MCTEPHTESCTASPISGLDTLLAQTCTFSYAPTQTCTNRLQQTLTFIHTGTGNNVQLLLLANIHRDRYSYQNAYICIGVSSYRLKSLTCIRFVAYRTSPLVTSFKLIINRFLRVGNVSIITIKGLIAAWKVLKRVLCKLWNKFCIERRWAFAVYISFSIENSLQQVASNW